MLTSAPPIRRAAYRPFKARVVQTTRLAPHFIRVTFTGEDLGAFGTEGLDQRIKLVLPIPGVGTSAFEQALGDPASAEDWYGAWRGLPDALRNPLRTYTVRAVRSQASEIDVDFVVHQDGGSEDGGSEDGGSASAWAVAAVTGDELLIVGPDSSAGQNFVGIAWQPGEASTFLLVGDETAAPAICYILESLGPDTTGQAFIEVPDVADILPLPAITGVIVTWLPRGGATPGTVLDTAVRAWVPQHLVEVALERRNAAAEGTFDADPDADADPDLLWDVPVERHGSRLYAWLAGEAGTTKELRRFLVRDTGFDRSQVAFMGYWRHGRSETN